MFLLSVLPLLAVGASAQSVVKEWTGVEATCYYDLAHLTQCFSTNGGPWPVDWYDTINSGYTACQGSDTTTYTLESLGSNRIVAMDLNTDGKGPEYWCGKEVEIFDASGNQVVLDEGPFVVYDNCGACGGGAIIDVSAKAFVQISGGTCGDNPTGLTVKVLDVNVSPSGTVGNSGAATVTSTAAAASATKTTSTNASTKISTESASVAVMSSNAQAATPTTSASSPVLTAGNLWVDTDEWETVCEGDEDDDDEHEWVCEAQTTTSAAATKTSSGPSRISSTASSSQSTSYPVNTPSDCTFGKYVCDGLTLKICNYVTWNALGWEEITTCPTSCTFYGSELECI